MDIGFVGFGVGFDGLERDITKSDLNSSLDYIRLLDPLVPEQGLLVENDHVGSVDLMGGIGESGHHFDTVLIIFLNEE